MQESTKTYSRQTVDSLQPTHAAKITAGELSVTDLGKWIVIVGKASIKVLKMDAVTHRVEGKARVFETVVSGPYGTGPTHVVPCNAEVWVCLREPKVTMSGVWIEDK